MTRFHEILIVILDDTEKAKAQAKVEIENMAMFEETQPCCLKDRAARYEVVRVIV